MATTKEIWKYDKSLLTFERSLVTEAQGAKMVAVINIQRRADKIVQSKALAPPGPQGSRIMSCQNTTHFYFLYEPHCQAGSAKSKSESPSEYKSQ